MLFVLTENRTVETIENKRELPILVKSLAAHTYRHVDIGLS